MEESRERDHGGLLWCPLDRQMARAASFSAASQVCPCFWLQSLPCENCLSCWPLGTPPPPSLRLWPPVTCMGTVSFGRPSWWRPQARSFLQVPPLLTGNTPVSCCQRKRGHTTSLWGAFLEVPSNLVSRGSHGELFYPQMATWWLLWEQPALQSLSTV